MYLVRSRTTMTTLMLLHLQRRTIAIREVVRASSHHAITLTCSQFYLRPPITAPVRMPTWQKPTDCAQIAMLKQIPST
ncbi:hypothetical protein BC834DRAFT_590196 [Gloeopeniophorella convolvens]|nr:hypothetical protein BC834DRAFT_590196 [Gloeopeniophorella convolvens]